VHPPVSAFRLTKTVKSVGLRLFNQQASGIAHLKCKHLSAYYRFIKLELDVAPCVGVTASDDDSAHGLMKGGPIIEVWH
jgi:hypothetical protein